MKGLKIDFTGNAPILNLNAIVENYEATNQNILVNIGTSSDAPIFEDRGTDLQSTMLESGYVSKVFSQHAANFAAIDTLYFVKNFNQFTDNLQDIKLYAPEMRGEDVSFKLETIFSDATIVTNLPL